MVNSKSGNQRLDETNNQLYRPSGCSGYEIWPMGYSVVPTYVAGLSESALNQQFTERNIIYLLGNGNQSDPSLNTDDCSATLLGTTRFRRGKNIYKATEMLFPGNNHSEVIVEGIGHDGRAMYLSDEFSEMLRGLLNNN